MPLMHGQYYVPPPMPKRNASRKADVGLKTALPAWDNGDFIPYVRLLPHINDLDCSKLTCASAYVCFRACVLFHTRLSRMAQLTECALHSPPPPESPPTRRPAHGPLCRWACSSCAFHNAAFRTKCTICQTSPSDGDKSFICMCAPGKLHFRKLRVRPQAKPEEESKEEEQTDPYAGIQARVDSRWTTPPPAAPPRQLGASWDQQPAEAAVTYPSALPAPQTLPLPASQDPDAPPALASADMASVLDLGADRRPPLLSKMTCHRVDTRWKAADRKACHIAASRHSSKQNQNPRQQQKTHVASSSCLPERSQSSPTRDHSYDAPEGRRAVHGAGDQNSLIDSDRLVGRCACASFSSVDGSLAGPMSASKDGAEEKRKTSLLSTSHTDHSAHERLAGAAESIHALLQTVKSASGRSVRMDATDALAAMSTAIRRALAAPRLECWMTSREQACIGNVPSGATLAMWCGFADTWLSEHGGPHAMEGSHPNERQLQEQQRHAHPGDQVLRTVRLRRPSLSTATEVALLRTIGEMLERSRVTPAQAVRSASPAGLRTPLMRCPPSHAGICSSECVPLYTTYEALVDRVAATLLEDELILDERSMVETCPSPTQYIWGSIAGSERHPSNDSCAGAINNDEIIPSGSSNFAIELF